MNKDTSSLYSGQSSGSLASKVSDVIQKGKDKEKQARSEAKKIRNAALKPAAEVVAKLIEDERQKILSIESIDAGRAVDERTFYTEVLARRRYDKFLLNLKRLVEASLIPDESVKQGESFDE